MENKPKRKLGCWWFLIPPALLVLVFFAQMWGPSPKIEISKKTTYIETNLDATGLPNYVDFLHDQLKQDVAPDENAAVLYWKALWPGEIGANIAHQKLLCEAMEMSVPLSTEAMVSVYGQTQGDLALWIKNNVLPPSDQGAVDRQQLETLDYTVEAPSDEEDADDLSTAIATTDLEYELQQRDETASEWAHEAISRSMYIPWTAADMPPVAKWVQDNEQSLDWLVEGSSRPKYYNPSPNMLDGSDDSVIAMLLPGAQMLRSATRGLTCRAMFNVGEGNAEEAWQDLKACHLMARHAARGGWTLVEQLIAIAIDAMAARGTKALLHHGNLTEEQAERIHRELQQMPHLPSVQKAMSEGERLMYLDVVKRLSTGSMDASDFGSFVGGGAGGNQAMGLVTSSRVDWNLVMERGNEWYDRLAETTKLSRTERIIASRQIDTDLQALNPRQNPSLLAGSLISSSARSELISDVMLNLLLPATTACVDATDRAHVIHEMNRVQAALALFRARHGHYPDSLDGLVPEIIKQVPADLYSGKPFVYSKTEEGFYLYSFFQNGIDDGGRDFEGHINGGKWVSPKLPTDMQNSDLVVLMPLRPFEISEPDE